MAKIACYLITGATGAIGSAIIPLLIEKKAKAFILVRGANNEEVQNKFMRLKQFLGIKHLDESIKAIKGDVEEIGLGLSQEDEILVSRNITHAIHSAGKVKMNLSIEEARRASIGSTNNLLDFLKKCPNFIKLEFVSTVGVAGKTIPCLKERYYSEIREYHNTYEQAKAEAEIILEKYLNEIPTTLHRPSMVVGDSHTGKIIHFQIFYYLCEFLTGKKTFGIMPDLSNATLDIVPSDYVAKAILESSLNDDWAGKVLHLSSGKAALPLMELKKAVKDFWEKKGLALPREIDLPLPLIKGGLHLITPILPAKTKKMISTLPIFLDYLESRQVFENSQTTHLLEKKGVSLPDPHNYLKNLLQYYFNNSKNNNF